MKNKNFNRLGGTEIRTKHQVNFYIMLCEWIKKMQTKESIRSLEEWNEAYKEWTKSEHIYNYKNDKKVPQRFRFIMKSLQKIGIHYRDQNFYIPRIINSDTIFQNLITYKNDDNVYPFQAMIDFAFYNPQKNNARKIILSFFVFDGTESFTKLYDKDNIIEELASANCANFPKFKKPPKAKPYMELIVQKKEQNLDITIDDLEGYSETGDKYIRPIVFKTRQKFNLTKMIHRLNQIDLKTFLYELHYNKLTQLLKGDYFDLFSRWLYDFGLVNVAGKKTSVFYNQKLKRHNGKYLIEKTKINTYPWKLNEVVTYLGQIAARDFTFKNRNQDLQYVANSTLAEYFVNLYYSYKLKIEPENFCQFANTKVSDQLQPIFTAPGNKPDMSYTNEVMLINIETTIHHTKNQVENNEIFPCTRHYETIAKQSTASSKYLIFISPLDPTLIANNFKMVFNDKTPRGKLIICQFDNLKLPFNSND